MHMTAHTQLSHSCYKQFVLKGERQSVSIYNNSHLKGDTGQSFITYLLHMIDLQMIAILEEEK